MGLGAWVVFGGLFGFLAYREARNFRGKWGRSPWNLDPVVWGLIVFFTGLLIGGVLLLVARRSTEKEVRAAQAAGWRAPVAQGMAPYAAAGVVAAPAAAFPPPPSAGFAPAPVPSYTPPPLPAGFAAPSSPAPLDYSAPPAGDHAAPPAAPDPSWPAPGGVAAPNILPQ